MTAPPPPIGRPELRQAGIAELQLGNSGLMLEGTSVAGVATWLRVPQWGIAFDIGLAAEHSVRCAKLAITHAHMDHAGGLPSWLALRRMYKLGPSVVYAPAEACGDLQAIVAIWERLHSAQFEWTLVAMEPGQEEPIGGGRRLRAFAADHVVPTLGYAVVAEITRLRSELEGLPRDTLRAMADRGEPVALPEDRVVLAISGDTRPTLIARVPELRQAQFAMHELTFLDDRRSAQEARQKGHTHLDELAEQLSDLQGVFLPYHLSQMYTAAGARRALRHRLPAAQWARTLPLLPPSPG
jgi:ribonuclease Z